MSIPRTTSPTQRVVNECGCGHKGTATVKRYDVVQCGKCGVFWWALQPKRNGPLEAWPWPGANLTRAELAEREHIEDKPTMKPVAQNRERRLSA